MNYIGLIVGVMIGIVTMACIQRWQQAGRRKQIEEIAVELKKALETHRRSILYSTSDKGYITLLNTVNQLLEHSQQAKADYIEIEEKMKKMLANISHDIKTPLTVISGYAEMLSADQQMSEKEIKELSMRIYHKTGELQGLIQEFFHLAKLESGDIKREKANFNLSELIRKSVVERYEELVAKEMEVKLQLPTEEVWIVEDVKGVRRIIDNLVTNAIRYGYEGRVLGIDLSKDAHRIRLSVWDKGKGIKETEQEHVFERLYTLEDSRNKHYQGSGLGLAITKKLVQEMGGAISLESQPYDKTEFVVELPYLTL